MADVIALENFRKALLGKWTAPIEGDVVSSPSDAAVRAAFEATITHARKRGTVLVQCTDAALRTACLDYLKTLFEDQPQLAALLKKATADGVDLASSQRILVTTSPRRPRDLLAAIRLERTEEAPTPEDRQRVLGSLTEFCRLSGFEPARHHRLLIEKLEAVSRGEIDRLAVFMPPGSAKTTYSSMLFPPWHIASHPGHAVICASHTAELAEKFGRRARNLLAEHAPTLGCELTSDSQAAGRWETKAGGEYFAAGVGGAITGRRADLVVIDDPVRSREDAESQLIRDRAWEWYRSDLYTRLKPGGRIVLIQTRWHEDDLAGRILAEMAAGGDKWEVVSLPALAEENDPIGRQPGEPLWPEWETLAELERKRRAVGPRDWSALFQQSPAPEEGDLFKAEWLRPYENLPPRETMRIYGASDYAVTAGGGDFTAHVVVGLDPQGRMYLLDLWRKQASSDVWVESFCDLVLRWKPLSWAEEQGQIKAGVGPFLERRQRDRKAYVVRTQFPTRGDKAVRARSIQGRMALEGLYVPINAAWFPAFRAELLSFPAGKHDDQVDALGLVGQLLDRMIKGTRPEEKEKPISLRQPTFMEAFKRHQRGKRRLEAGGIITSMELN